MMHRRLDHHVLLIDREGRVVNMKESETRK
jgi:hypothetical protein